MSDLYVELIKAGKRTVAQVPEGIRAEVEAMLNTE